MTNILGIHWVSTVLYSLYHFRVLNYHFWFCHYYRLGCLYPPPQRPRSSLLTQCRDSPVFSTLSSCSGTKSWPVALWHTTPCNRRVNTPVRLLTSHLLRWDLSVALRYFLDSNIFSLKEKTVAVTVCKMRTVTNMMKICLPVNVVLIFLCRLVSRGALGSLVSCGLRMSSMKCGVKVSQCLSCVTVSPAGPITDGGHVSTELPQAVSSQQDGSRQSPDTWH